MARCSRCKKQRKPLHKRNGALFCNPCMGVIGEARTAQANKYKTDNTVYGIDFGALALSAKERISNQWWKRKR